MDRSIYTYALIKSLYDQGHDYIDSFWPFAIGVIPAEIDVEAGFVQRELNGKYGFKIPLHVLEIILTRAKRRGCVEKKDEKRYKLTEKGRVYLDKLETEKQVERRINNLLEDMKKFFQKGNLPLNVDQINDLLLSFLQKNIEYFVEFINPSIAVAKLAIPSIGSQDNLLIEYIKLAEEKKPENYNTLQEMVFGSIISVVLYIEEPSEITEIRRRKFRHRQIFLDTNFVFSILELHNHKFNEPAKELFILVKRYGFDIKVFDFTVNEICRVINKYISESHRYPITVGVDTLFSSLKRKGWTKTDTREFIADIENILKNNGIKIERTNINLDTYEPKNKELRDLMGAYKPWQELFNRNHDLASIEKIIEFRGKPVRRIENSKACFITSDVRLCKFNLREMGHKENGTVCEAVLDRVLTNILWLKDPSIKLPLKAIIAAHSRGLFIKRRIWDKFYDALQQLKKEGKADDEKISNLFYHGYIEDVLREFEEPEADKITPEFALEEIEKAAQYKEELRKRKIKELEKAKDEEIERKIKQQEGEFIQRLKKTVSNRELEKETEWLGRIEEIKKKIRNRAEKSTKRVFFWKKTFFVAIITILFAVCLIKYGWDVFDIPRIIFMLILAIIGGAGISIKRLWQKGEEKCYTKIYNKKIKELGLHEYE